MKKIIVLLAFLLAAIGTVAAQQQRKQPVKKVTVSAEEHLCFEGVPINGSTESFIKALAKKGIKAKKFKDSDYFYYKGKKMSIILNSEYEYYDSIYSVRTLYPFKRTESEDKKANAFIKNLQRKIEQQYNCKKNSYHFYSADNYWSMYEVFSLYNKFNRKIGDITFTIYYSYNDNYDNMINIEYIDYKNVLKHNLEEYDYCNSEIDWEKYPYTVNGFSDVNIGKEKITGNIFVKALLSNNPNKKYSFILTREDKHLFYNLMEKCKDAKLRDYLINGLFENIRKIVEYPNETYIFSDVLTLYVTRYYSRLESEEKERQRQRQQQLAQRRKSFGFMDLMHLLAPGFFTQDDVELWNKMSESDQKAIIQGSFGAYFGMGDTRGHTEKMHTPSLRNQQ